MTCCEACRASLNIFIRKKCSACGQAHCTRCLTVVTPDCASACTAVLVRGRNRKFCIKCAMLISGDYSRDDLSTRYTVRELRTFLVGCKMAITGCTEKADLIELAMKASHAPSRLRSEDHEHASHVARLKEKMMTEMQSDTAAVAMDTQTTDDIVQLSEAVADDNSLSAGEDRPTPASNVPHSAGDAADDVGDAAEDVGDADDVVMQVDESNTDSRHPVNVLSTGDDDLTASANDGDDVSTGIPTPASGQSSSSASPFRQSTEHRRVLLSEIHDVASIELLSVRQLKDLLASNFVDYKGCCEKPELVMRVQQLWTDHQRNVSYVASSSDETNAAEFDSNLCKVCMDAVIDCLLLECGHMVTCTACGKRLCECPICRHYVVRVVRVFRA